MLISLILHIGGSRMEQNEYWFWLCNIRQIGNNKIRDILTYYKTPKSAFLDNGDGLNHIPSLSSSDKLMIMNSKDINKIKDNYAKLARASVYFVSKENNAYPDKLKHIYQSPYGLYVKGNLPKEEEIVIAIVGARNCSDYGSEIAEYMAYELARRGISIISGLAHGIDNFAHRGALRASGKTYGVLGSGVDICYPKENFKTYLDIQSNGGVISEYGLGIWPKPGFFPQRNRIISGISDGVLLIEAKEQSGSLITVDYGLEQGKNIYVIPGRIKDELSKGCNNLIKMGAKLVSEPNDIIEDFSKYSIKLMKDIKKNDKLLETEEKIVYAMLSFHGKHINEISYQTNISIPELTPILLNLELKNYIKQVRNNVYAHIDID